MHCLISLLVTFLSRVFASVFSPTLFWLNLLFAGGQYVILKPWLCFKAQWLQDLLLSKAVSGLLCIPSVCTGLNQLQLQHWIKPGRRGECRRTYSTLSTYRITIKYQQLCMKNPGVTDPQTQFPLGPLQNPTVLLNARFFHGAIFLSSGHVRRVYVAFLSCSILTFLPEFL